MLALHSSNRREFLVHASCFGAAAAFAKYFPAPLMAESLAQDARIAATPMLDKGFASSRRIGAGVCATIADASKGPEAFSNGGCIFGRDAALLLEGHHTPVGAAFEYEALRMVSQAPVRAALDTHYHFDHTFGNAFYAAQRIPIYGHAKCAPLIVERYASLQSGAAAAFLGQFEKGVAAAKNEAEKQRAQGDLGAATIVANSTRNTPLTLPNLPLDPGTLPMTLDLGGVQAVIETHPGHTPTDLIVRVPEQNIVFTGDLLFNGAYPVTFDGNMTAWMATLDKFHSLDRDTIFVPGHGGLCGREVVAQQRAVFDDLANHAAKMKKAGVPWQEAAQRYVVPEQFKSFWYFSWGFCIGAAIARFYEEK